MFLKPSMSASWSLTLIHLDLWSLVFFCHDDHCLYILYVCGSSFFFLFNHLEMGAAWSIFNSLALTSIWMCSKLPQCKHGDALSFWMTKIFCLLMFTVVSEHFCLCILIFFVSSRCLTVYYPQPLFKPVCVCVCFWMCVCVHTHVCVCERSLTLPFLIFQHAVEFDSDWWIFLLWWTDVAWLSFFFVFDFPPSRH